MPMLPMPGWTPNMFNWQWVIAALALLQAVVLLVLVKVTSRHIALTRQVLAVATATEVKLIGLHAVQGMSGQVWDVENIGPNVALNVKVQVLVTDGRNRQSWVEAEGPSHIDGKSRALFEARGMLSDQMLVQISWITLGGDQIEKTYSWVRGADGAETVSVVRR